MQNMILKTLKRTQGPQNCNKLRWKKTEILEAYIYSLGGGGIN